MNKIAFISDLHFGVHKNSDTYLNSQLCFFDEQFIPYLKTNDIKKVCILGDVFESRNTINVKIYDSVYNLFERLSEFDVYVILGNHDTYYTTTTDVHSLKYLSKFPNVKLIESIYSETIYGKNFLFVPWQVDIAQFANEVINYNKIDVCLGHFDIIGCTMHKSRVCDVGVSRDLFHRFDQVFSGHYHTRSKQENITYIGSPFWLTRNDSDEDRGFCIYNCDDSTYEYVSNEKSIKYVTVKYPNELSADVIKNNVVDVYVDYTSEYDSAKFQIYLDNLQKSIPVEVSVKLVNKFLSGEEIDILDSFRANDIKALVDEYVNNLEIERKDNIKKILADLMKEIDE